MADSHTPVNRARKILEIEKVKDFDRISETILSLVSLHTIRAKHITASDILCRKLALFFDWQRQNRVLLAEIM